MFTVTHCVVGRGEGWERNRGGEEKTKMKKTLVGGGGGGKKEITGAGEGMTNRVPGVPYGTICHAEVTNRVWVTSRAGITSNLTRLFTCVTHCVKVTNK